MRLLLFLGFLILLSCSGQKSNQYSVSSGRPSPILKAKLATSNYKSVEEILKSLRVKDSDISFVLFDVAGKNAIGEKNANELFTPASVAKMISGYYALEKLGANHRFKTQLKSDKKGNLYLVGGGDPYLFSHDLMDMAIELAKHLKNKPKNFYYDDYLFEARNEVENTQEDGETYNPSISALSADYNLFHFHQLYSPKENTLEFFTSPSFSKKDFRYGGNFTYLGFLESLRQEAWLIPEEGKNGKTILPHKNSAFVAANMLRFFAERNGLELPMPARKKATADLKTIVIHQSPELKTIMTLGMEFSNNFIFEQLFMSASAQGDFGITQEEAQNKLIEFLANKTPNFKWEGFFLKNGSGLSHDSKVSANQLLEIIKLAGPKLMTTMPIGGYKGTLENRFIEPPLNFNIWAKTGTMDFVSSLAGTLFSEQGKKYYFVILMNKKSNDSSSKDHWNREARKVQEEIVKWWVLNN